MSSREYGNMPHNGYRTGRPPQPALHPSQPVKTLESGEIFSGAREVAINHAGALYRLKITRQGKLILNK